MWVGFLFCASPRVTLAAQPACNAAALPACAEIGKAPLDVSNSTGLGFSTPRDGGVTFNFYAAYKLMRAAQGKTRASLKQPDVASMAEVTEARATKSLAVIEALRKRAVALVSGTTRPLSEEQAVLVQRLETLNIRKISNEDRLCSRDVPLGIPNLGWDSASHTLQICPAALNLSEAQLTEIAAHELGHVVNPCATAETLFQIDATKATKDGFANCHPSLAVDHPREKLSDEDLATLRMINNETKYAVGDPKIAYYRTLAKCGILIPAPVSNKTGKATLFKSTMNCLDRRYSEAYEDSLFEDTIGLIKRGLTEAQANARVRSLSPSACFKKENEDFSDIFSAKLLSEIGVGWPLDAVKSSLLKMQSYTCFEKLTRSRVFIGYPSASHRLQTMMNDPGISSRLNCAPVKAAAQCALQLNYPTAPTAPAASTVEKPAPAASAQ